MIFTMKDKLTLTFKSINNRNSGSFTKKNTSVPSSCYDASASATARVSSSGSIASRWPPSTRRS